MSAGKDQELFVSRLREFIGPMPAAYAGEKEFFTYSIRSMAGHLLDLKKKALSEACEAFLRESGKGKVAERTTEDFKAVLEKLVSEKDFRSSVAALVGSAGFLGQRLSVLAPVSLTEEEKKTEGRDPEAERHIRLAYARLEFSALSGELGAGASQTAVDSVLVRARAEVAEYCCLYGIRTGEGAEFTPYTLRCIDAALAASQRFIAEIDRRTLLLEPDKKMVLIADDDESLLEILELVVKREGFATETATTGREAMSKAKGLRPALILLDLNLPGGTGFEILRELQCEGTSDIPVIVMTGREIARSTLELIKRESNVREFFVKPVKHQVLSALLHELTRRR